MILDERNEFADAVSVAGAAGSAVLGDVIDTGGDGLEGNSEEVYLVIQTDTEVVTGGAAGTIQFDLVSDSLATLGGGVVGNCTLHFSTGALTTGAAGSNDPRLNAGENIAVVELPRGTYERYLGVIYTIGTTATTAGAVNAFLTNNPPSWKATPENIPTPV